MELTANYIGEGKIFIPGHPSFSSRYEKIDEKSVKGLKINDKIKIEYQSPSDIKVLEVLKPEKNPS